MPKPRFRNLHALNAILHRKTDPFVDKRKEEQRRACRKNDKRAHEAEDLDDQRDY